MLTMIAEQIVNGIVSGSVYAIVAVGMTMIFGVLRAINFAHGEYYMLGTFGAWFAIEYLELPYPVALVIGVIATAVIAVVVGKFVMQRIVGAPPETGVLATLGIALVLQNTVILVFGGGYKFFSGGYIEPVSIFGFTLAEQRVLAARQHAPAAAAEGNAELKLAFDQFVDQYAANKGVKTISAGEQEILFAKFRQFLQAQSNTMARSR